MHETKAEQLEQWLQDTLAQFQYARITYHVLADAFPYTPPSAEAISQDIQKLLRHEPVPLLPKTPAEQMAEMCQRNNWQSEENSLLHEVKFWKKRSLRT